MSEDYGLLIKTLEATRLARPSVGGLCHQAAVAIAQLLNDRDIAEAKIADLEARLHGNRNRHARSCRGCGRGIPQTEGKRTRVWCEERCRSRYRRDQLSTGKPL